MIATIYLADCRAMPELLDESIQLVITSPPYWHIKDYGATGQVGYGQSLHEYLRDLYRAWKECVRVLAFGRRLCINIGDQFARKTVYGRYRVIPLHAEVIAQCESLGLDYLGAIIWQKKTRIETSGGAVVMGSYPYPPNGILELDFEYILLFRKPGVAVRPSSEVREAARLTRDEWKKYFSGHWRFPGARQLEHEAVFPDELPRRLIRMFSFPGETVLDPFLGSGTTAAMAVSLERFAVGYEISRNFIPSIQRKVPGFVRFGELPERPPVSSDGYHPRVPDARPKVDPVQESASREGLVRVTEVLDPVTLRLSDGGRVRLRGITIGDRDGALDYLRQRVEGKEVYIRRDEPDGAGYVYLKNRIFVNGYLVRSGLATNDEQRPHPLSERFRRFAAAAAHAREAGGEKEAPDGR